MEDAAARKERLRALRAAAEAADGGEMVLKFRNYQPQTTTEDLPHERLLPAKAPQLATPAAIEPSSNLRGDEPQTIADIAPKKPNWDLRRDVSKKLEKLERRTQRAIIELMQQEDLRRAQETLQTAPESVE